MKANWGKLPVFRERGARRRAAKLDTAGRCLCRVQESARVAALKRLRRHEAQLINRRLCIGNSLVKLDIAVGTVVAVDCAGLEVHRGRAGVGCGVKGKRQRRGGRSQCSL